MAVASTSKAIKTGGDDLDDGLELDPELLAPSDGSDVEGEEVDVDETRVDGVDEEDEADDGDLQEDEEEPRKRAGVKRKVENLDEDAKAEEKKRRKKEKEKERKARRMAEDPTNVPKFTSATNLSAAQLSEMLLASIRETFRSATTMEIDELIIPESSLLEPLGSIPPTDDPFGPLGFRLKTLVKDVNVKKIPAATPKVIILSLSGMRCADVVRAVKPFKGTGEVAKLFAKHLKFEDQVRYLEKTKVSIAVGTPARVSKLLSEGAMKVKEGSVILLDATYKDPKQRSLLTLPEIRTELWKSLFSGKARETILNSGAKIGAF